MADKSDKSVKTVLADADDFRNEGKTGMDPLTIVIFGASGDLTFRKLIPALYDLYGAGFLNQSFRIVGTARTKLDNTAFRSKLRDEMAEDESRDLSRWDEFAGKISYVPAEYDSADDFKALAKYLHKIDADAQAGGNRIFYLALPPSVYLTVAKGLGESGLACEGSAGGWVRIVVEKPFGRDLKSAQALNRTLLSIFDEHQIYRIDHFLAKETVQNVLTFRLANAIFEPIWNRRYIDHVSIIATETLGVENRAGYYEQAGVLRDMIQNHLMQLLSVIAIEPPSRWEAEMVRDEKVKLFRSLRPFPVSDDIYDNIVLGQYSAGEVDGQTVPAYRDEPGVFAGSLTPTYARLRIFIDNWRWQGVPFFLTSGKRLREKMTEAVIQFKRVPHSMFRDVVGNRIEANRLTIGIQPEETMSLSFQTKAPGPRLRLRPAELHFDYRTGSGGPSLDSYAKVLLDCIAGDHMLFWRQDGIEESWRFIDPILERCEGCEERKEHLHMYKAGGWGPERALRMLRDA